MDSLATLLFVLATLMASSACQTGVTNNQIDPKEYVFDFKAIQPSLKGPGGKKNEIKLLAEKSARKTGH
jgi:hypothetical protein